MNFSRKNHEHRKSNRNAVSKTKKLFLVFALFVGALQIHAQITLSHHVDPATVDTSGLACTGSNGESFDNYFARVYNLNTFGITGGFLISDVEVGIGDDHGASGKIVNVNVYTSDSEDLTTAILTLVSTTEVTLQASSFSLLSVAIGAVNISAGSIIVVETFYPADPTIHCHPGFNLAGDTGIAWVKVPDCGIPNWQDTDAGGASGQDILINIVGTEILRVNDITLENVVIYPNPTEGDFSIDLAKSYDEVDLTITNIIGQRLVTSKFSNTDKLELSIDGEAGIYFVTINTSEGKSETLKIIKK